MVDAYLGGLGFPRRNLEGRNERALGIRQQVHKLHFGEIAYNLNRRESRVVDADATEVLQLRSDEMAQHGANNVAMRDEQDALLRIRLDRAPHRPHPALLHLRDRLAPGRRPGQWM